MNTETPKAALAGFSLDEAVPVETFDYTVKRPGTEEPLDWIVTFAGPSHPKSIDLNDKSARKSLNKAKLIEQARINGKKFKSDELTPEEDKHQFIESIVGRIVGWKTSTAAGPSFKGKVYPFSDQLATELLMFPEMGTYVAQFVEVLLEEKNFMPASPKP